MGHEAPHPFYGYYGPELRIQGLEKLEMRFRTNQQDRLDTWILLDLTGSYWM